MDVVRILRHYWRKIKILSGTDPKYKDKYNYLYAELGMSPEEARRKALWHANS